MDFKALTEAVLSFVKEHQSLAPLICGLLAFGESLALISLIVPASGILAALGALIISAKLDIWSIVAAAVIGATLGDWVSYEIAKYYKYSVFRVWPLSRNQSLIERGETFIRKYGVWAIFFGRFFGPFRAVVPLFAGIFSMPYLRFMIANVTSAIIWAFGILVAPGWGLNWIMGW